MASFDKLFSDLVAQEVNAQLAPILSQLQQQSEVIARLGSAFGAPVRRGPGRPPKALGAVKVSAPKAAKAVKVRSSGGQRGCAVIGCPRPARAKGYCAAHYQKYRNLEKTGRLPSDWTPDAAPQSANDVVLPRGRAGAKALAEAKKGKKK